MIRTHGRCYIPLGGLEIKSEIINTASQVALVVKNTPASAGDRRDVGSIPGLGRSPGRGNGNLLQYSWPKKIPWTEEPGGLQSMGSQKS